MVPVAGRTSGYRRIGPIVPLQPEWRVRNPVGRAAQHSDRSAEYADGFGRQPAQRLSEWNKDVNSGYAVALDPIPQAELVWPTPEVITDTTGTALLRRASRACLIHAVEFLDVLV